MAAVTVSSPPTTKVRDTRTFWRVLLAVIAPIPALVIGVTAFIAPYEYGADDGTAQFEATVAHSDRVLATLLLSPLMIFTLVPAAYALMWVCRRKAPLYSTILGVLMTMGFLAGTANPSIDLIYYVGAQNNLDQATVIELGNEISNSGFSAILVFMLLAITVGRLAAAVLLWRIRIAPRWMAVAIGLAVPVEFIPILDGNIQPGIAWILTAVGFASASVALLRTPNDEFDLPPAAHP